MTEDLLRGDGMRVELAAVACAEDFAQLLTRLRLRSGPQTSGARS
ncbi:MAG: hypothetical protein ACK5MT_15575 [Actinomycetales bacterium]